MWQYVAAALHDMEHLADHFGQLDRFCDSIIELENRFTRDLNVFNGGSNAQPVQKQEVFVESKRTPGKYIRKTRNRKTVVGPAAQRLRKKTDGKELARFEKPRLTKSDKRRRVVEAKSERTRQRQKETRQAIVRVKRNSS